MKETNFFSLPYFNDVERTECHEWGERSKVNCWGQGQIGDGDRQMTISVDFFSQPFKSFFSLQFFCCWEIKVDVFYLVSWFEKLNGVFNFAVNIFYVILTILINATYIDLELTIF